MFSITDIHTICVQHICGTAAFDLKEKMFQDTGLTTLKSYWSVRKVAGPTNCHRVSYNML